MKVKSRDLFIGWPRGKSQRAAFYYGANSPVDLFWHSFGRARWEEDDIRRFIEDAIGNTKYHQEQEKMLYEHLERYRSSKDSLSLLHDRIIQIMFSNVHSYQTFLIDDKFITYKETVH